jgi:hypothetical protein
MQAILGALFVFLMGVVGVSYFKLAQFKNPKAAFWYFLGAYCMANGDAEMRRIERLEANCRIMEDLCGGKIEGDINDRQTQNS